MVVILQQFCLGYFWKLHCTEVSICRCLEKRWIFFPYEKKKSQLKPQLWSWKLRVLLHICKSHRNHLESLLQYFLNYDTFLHTKCHGQESFFCKKTKGAQVLKMRWWMSCLDFTRYVSVWVIQAVFWRDLVWLESSSLQHQIRSQTSAAQPRVTPSACCRWITEP